MAAQLLEIHPDNPQAHKIAQVVECLRAGGVVIYPTDTVYGLGCDPFHAKAVDRIAAIKNIRPEKNNFSIICNDLSHISEYVKQVPNPVFKVLKKALPGPFTFIFDAGGNLPKAINQKKKTIGIRVPNHPIPRLITEALGTPLLNTSIKNEDEVLEYMTDPEAIYAFYKHKVDIVIDGGFGSNIPSTVVDCSKGAFLEIIRFGAGNPENYW